MKFIKKMISGIVRWAVVAEDDRKQEVDWASPRPKSLSPGISTRRIEDASRGINFTVYSAIGGKVVQTIIYDEHTDRTRSNLYVVTDKEDLGEEIGQIITRESLSR